MSNPAVLVAVPLLAGVATGVWLSMPIGVVRVVLGVVWVATVAAASLRAAPLALAVLLVAGFTTSGLLLGATRHVAALETPLARWFDDQPGAAGGRVGPVLIEGRLRADATPTDYGVTLRLMVERIGRADLLRPTSGGVRLSVGGRRWSGRMAGWRAGRLVRVYATLRRPAAYRNPGVADQARRQAMRGTALIGSVKSGLLVDVARRGSVPAELASSARAAVRRGIGRSVGRHGVRSAAIVTAVLIGDRAGLDETTTRRMQEGGTYHVIAISGGNIAILAGCLLLLGRSAGLRPRRVSGAAILLLVAYAYLVGHEASVARATTAAVIVLGAGLLDHRTPPVNVLAVAAIGIVLVSPLALFDAGFLLTFGATLGIVLGTSRLGDTLCRIPARWVDPLPRWVTPPMTLLAATLCAEAALMPVGAALFARVTLAGLVLNFLAIPLMTVTQLAGMAALGLEVFHPLLANPAGFLAHLAATGLVESTRLLDLWPWLVFRVPAPSTPVLVVYYGGLMWLFRTGISARARASAQILLALAAIWVVSALSRPALTGGPPAGWMRVSFLDVGQADATLVQTPSGRSLLVDAGGSISPRSDIGSRVVAPALWALGVRRLDVAALSHGDPDHIGGLGAVVQDFAPREVWEGVPVPRHRQLDALRLAAANAGAAWRRVTAGDRFDLGGVSIAVVHPPPPDWERVRVRNDDSIVLDVRYGDVAVLLPGDIGQEVEGRVANAIDPVAFRIVKVPHHGSAGSSSPGLVEATEPCVAVISAGQANPFGHPAPEVVRRYRDTGALVLDTGRDGAVTVETDGREVWVRTEGGRRFGFRADRRCEQLES
ncbi:MAG: DNA internalization-related competence protein ComEC/Rec2 [Vicinamibacterales bacterium]|nr:DNA internalization-related competence protein ComEC/Rec2 [Vicinamibacterales bacterium]